MANGNSHQWQPQLIHRRAGTAFSPESGNSELRVSSLESGDRGSGFGSLDSQVRSPWSVRPMEWSGHGHGGAVTASSSRDSSWPVAIKNDSHPQYQRWPQNQHGSPANQFICWPVGNAVNFSNCQTADYGLWTTDCGQRSMDNGLRRLNLSCSLVCPPCWI